MKADQENKRDDFTRNIIKDSGIYEAPNDFTESVMDRVQWLEESKIDISYRPLLSKKSWILIAAGIMGICYYLLTNEPQFISGSKFLPFAQYLPNLDALNLWEGLRLERLGSIKIYNSVIYAVLMLPVFFYLQIYFLQKRQAE